MAILTVNIHEAKTQLSKLVDRASKGESFIIAKAGKPMVKVVPIEAQKKPKRFGFLKGKIHLPDNFDQMDQEIARLLYGEDE